MRNTLSSLIAATLLVALVAQAGDIFRWKDANGIVHYADQPVPGAERISSSRTAAEAEAAAAAAGDPVPRKLVPPPPSAANTPAAQTSQKVREDVAAAKAEHCKQAQTAYEQSISARRLFKPGPNGEPVYLDDAQIDAHRVAARSEMEILCGK
jgi:hypothetical protein